MALQLVEIIFNDTPSKYNRDLTEFLKRNIETIILKGKLKLKFTIANNNDLNKLVEIGVKRLPVMFIQKKSFVSVPIIVEEIRRIVNNSKNIAPPKNEDEVLQDHFNACIGQIRKGNDGKIQLPKENDEYEDEENKMMDKFYQEAAKRDGKKEGGPYTGIKPNRNYENEEMEALPPQIVSDASRNHRTDNISIPGSASASLKKLRSGGDGSTDDALMQALLQKIDTAD